MDDTPTLDEVILAGVNAILRARGSKNPTEDRYSGRVERLADGGAVVVLHDTRRNESPLSHVLFLNG